MIRKIFLLIVFGFFPLAAQTYYYGPGCNGTPNNSSCTTAGTSQSSVTSYIIGSKITTGSNSAGYTLNGCAGYLSAAVSSTIKCGVYTGGTGTQTRVCVASATSLVSTSAGWYEIYGDVTAEPEFIDPSRISVTGYDSVLGGPGTVLDYITNRGAFYSGWGSTTYPTSKLTTQALILWMLAGWTPGNPALCPGGATIGAVACLYQDVTPTGAVP